MHPNRGVFCTDRQANVLSMISDGRNTLTGQSASMNGSSRDPLYGPVTGIDGNYPFSVTIESG